MKKKKSAGGVIEKKEIFYTVGRNVKCTAIMKTVMTFPQKCNLFFRVDLKPHL